MIAVFASSIDGTEIEIIETVRKLYEYGVRIEISFLRVHCLTHRLTCMIVVVMPASFSDGIEIYM